MHFIDRARHFGYREEPETINQVPRALVTQWPAIN
jgi:hypothetical protein